MIRVLHVLGSMKTGGMQSFIMNVYRRIDRKKVQFDFLVNYSDGEGFETEIKALGGVIYTIPPRNKGLLMNRRAIEDFFKEHNNFDVVHLHESSLSYITPLIVAKKVGIPNRIIHAHSTNVKSNRALHLVFHRINAIRLHKYATKCIACGNAAGNWMYGHTRFYNTFDVVYNGIDTSKYLYNNSKRTTVRVEMGIDDCCVVGIIGRLEPVKNHKYAIIVLRELVKMCSNSKLLVVGNGSLLNDLQQLCQDVGVEDHVLFLGNRNDVHVLYNAMDCVIMPSFYEGFPVTGIEAQVSGLPIVFSNTITEEVAVNDNAVFLGLEKGEAKWAETVLKLKDSRIAYYNEKLDKFRIDCTLNQLLLAYGAIECMNN